MPNAHARAKERFNQATPFKNLQHRRLKSGPASLAVRGEPALDDARLDAMAEEFTGCEQSSRAGPNNQDRCRRIIYTGIQQPTLGSLICYERRCSGCCSILQRSQPIRPQMSRRTLTLTLDLKF